MMINYLPLDAITPNDFIPIFNKSSIRQHLIEHAPFDAQSIKTWVREKRHIDTQDGCLVRAVSVNNCLVGWCGIQRAECGFELAIVLDTSHWGLGRYVFKFLLSRAEQLGHQVVYLHLLHTRRESTFLTQRALRVFKTHMLGECFTTYEIKVGD
ncbi:GNAT family N-acetyltransferase [Salinivibrio sp. SS2]|uniref:GNAT family N-acetyltransferase n=1 Tax=Salinivibrio sp. SS2 TaxID=1892894 RepID=UPI00084CC2D2|nr:GNAT family N-acetyltransferase [Salinivibrio sp. DV]ODQ00301.1 hypothetical protein BGK46_07465 [Salinivibrio sp. DV]